MVLAARGANRKAAADGMRAIIDESGGAVGWRATGSASWPQQLDLAITPPDYLLLVGWNYADEILRCEKHLREQGVKFILPIPVPQVMSSTDRRLWTAV
jgi:hypothetical protein